MVEHSRQKIDRMTIDVLRNFFDNVMVYNENGTLLYSCEKFWQDTGLNPEEFEGKGIEEISRLNIYSPYAAEHTYRTGEKITVVQSAFGNEIAVATAFPIHDQEGKLILIVTYAENNERIIELEARLDEMTRFVEEKNEEISHLLSNILGDGHIGKSTEVLKVHKLLERIRDFDANILLLGETGVGKTMYAKKIHATSNRKENRFVEINCAAIPEALLESELFGYDKGAFTGANEKGKIGQIELADGGTLFLDEISELNINLQSKLLKVIQDKQVLRVGGTTAKKVDFRLVAASNVDLYEMVEAGKFRRDLFYRLNVVPIQIPALRNRKEDIHLLAKDFLNTFNQKYGEQKMLDKRVITCLTNYSWPGNVRELENAIERMVLTAEKPVITIGDLPENIYSGITINKGVTGDLQEVLDGLEREILDRTYKEFGGNITQIASTLGLTRQSVLRRIKKYGLDHQS